MMDCVGNLTVVKTRGMHRKSSELSVIAITDLGCYMGSSGHICMEKSYSYGVTVKTVFQTSSVFIAFKVDGFQIQFLC